MSYNTARVVASEYSDENCFVERSRGTTRVAVSCDTARVVATEGKKYEKENWGEAGMQHGCPCRVTRPVSL